MLQTLVLLSHTIYLFFRSWLPKLPYYVGLLNHELATQSERIAWVFYFNELFYKYLLSSQEHHVQPLLRGTQTKDLDNSDSRCNRRVHYFPCLRIAVNHSLSKSSKVNSTKDVKNMWSHLSTCLYILHHIHEGSESWIAMSTCEAFEINLSMVCTLHLLWHQSYISTSLSMKLSWVPYKGKCLMPKTPSIQKVYSWRKGGIIQ